MTIKEKALYYHKVRKWGKDFAKKFPFTYTPAKGFVDTKSVIESARDIVFREFGDLPDVADNGEKIDRVEVCYKAFIAKMIFLEGVHGYVPVPVEEEAGEDATELFPGPGGTFYADETEMPFFVYD